MTDIITSQQHLLDGNTVGLRSEFAKSANPRMRPVSADDGDGSTGGDDGIVGLATTVNVPVVEHSKGEESSILLLLSNLGE